MEPWTHYVTRLALNLQPLVSSVQEHHTQHPCATFNTLLNQKNTQTWTFGFDKFLGSGHLCYSVCHSRKPMQCLILVPSIHLASFICKLSPSISILWFLPLNVGSVKALPLCLQEFTLIAQWSEHIAIDQFFCWVDFILGPFQVVLL